MTKVNTETLPGLEEEDYGATPKLFGFLAILVPVFALLLLALFALSAFSSSLHSYTGTGTIKSHLPFGNTSCKIVVEEDGGGEYSYLKAGGIFACNPIKDGSKVEIENGQIVKITAP